MAVALGLFPPVPEGSNRGLFGEAFRTFREVAGSRQNEPLLSNNDLIFPLTTNSYIVLQLHHNPLLYPTPTDTTEQVKFLVADNLKLLAHYGVVEDTLLVFTGGNTVEPTGRIVLDGRR